ncbi:hypothetical protein V8C37DRAFT_395826 [Trichoderma ceciliae]
MATSWSRPRGVQKLVRSTWYMYLVVDRNTACVLTLAALVAIFGRYVRRFSRLPSFSRLASPLFLVFFFSLWPLFPLPILYCR